MSLKKGLFSGAALAIAIGGFAVAGSAQTTTESGDNAVKTERQSKGWGKGKRGGKRGMRGHRGGMGFRGLELTEAQKVQMNAIRQANQPDAGLREEMKSIMQARRAGTITEDQKLRMESLRSQMKANREVVRLQMEAILTPEQKVQLEARKAEMQQKMQERRQKMQERRIQKEQKQPATN